jgi:hypothetical protein
MPLGRPKNIWEDNIKMGLKEVGHVCKDWIDLAGSYEYGLT